MYSTEGMLVPVGKRKEGASQHCGVGTTLVKKSEYLSRLYGFEGVAVISGPGVRGYYKKLGYSLNEESGKFMTKSFFVTFDFTFIICLLGFIVFIYQLIYGFIII